MKITGLETFIVAPRWCFLKITTDEGLVGWGEPVLEGRAHTVAAAVEELADYLIGEDPLQIERHWQTLYRGGFYRGGGIHMSAIAGIDQALWDIKGKFHDTPVHQLLGGQVRDRIRVYAWVGGDRPADIVNSAQQAISDGFKATKMNLTEEMQIVDSHSKIDDAVQRIAHLREAVGSALDIAVDFHGRVHVPMAKALIHAIEPYSPLFVEEPVLSEHLDAMAELRRHTHVPIATGETTVLPFRFQKPVYPWGSRHHPAGSFPRWRHYRMQKNRRYGGNLGYCSSPALPARPHCLGRLSAGRRCLPKRLYSGAKSGYSLQSSQRPNTLSGQSLRFSPFKTASLASPKAQDWASRSMKRRSEPKPRRVTGGATRFGDILMAASPSGKT